LAQWCERHGLYHDAAAELADAAVIEPNHPMLDVLRRRLELAMQPQRPVEPAGKTAAPPSADELDRMTRNMPPGSVEMFAQVVQPLLMNHCMASGCHGPQSDTTFRLLRAPLSQPAGRRLTQRNLHAVLQYVNYADAPSSRFLTAISGPHGPVKTPIFTDHQAGQYKRVADWLNLVTRQPGAQEIPASVSMGAERKTTPPPPADDASPRLLPAAAMHGRPLAHPRRDGPAGPVRPASATEAKAHPPREPKRDAKPSPPQAQADPFDPELYNRQYSPGENGAKKVE
jgi:hypothetical protein